MDINNLFFNRLKKKGQILSLDVIFTLITFLIILLFFFWSWNSFADKQYETETNNEMNAIAMYAASSLVETYGSPINWSSYSTDGFNLVNINSLGLASKVGVLDYDRILALAALNSTDYDTVKTLLGVIGPNYELKIIYYYYDGSNYVKDSNSEFGYLPTNTKRVVKVNRNFIINTPDKNWSKMELYVSEVDNG